MESRKFVTLLRTCAQYPDVEGLQFSQHKTCHKRLVIGIRLLQKRSSSLVPAYQEPIL
jgi:hypothetical protein